MADLLRIFISISCLMSGIYGLIFLLYRKNRRTVLMYYVLLCFAFAFHSNFALSVSAFETIHLNPLFINFYLFSYGCVIFLLTMFVSAFLGNWKHIHLRLYSILALIVTASALFVGSAAYEPFLVLLNIFSFISYVYALIVSIDLFKKQSSTYIYSVVSQALMIVALIVNMILGIIIRDVYYSPRILIVPVYLVLHFLMITYQYKQSTERTKVLSDSLSTTIEKIKHSKNALMCTQMKSEFLYDTLDLISERCTSDPDTAEFLTVSLSRYLRHTLNFQQLNGIVPLENEMELIKAYAVIEAEKHPNITFDYRIPDPIPDIYIPPLSIQPLIENSIEHGILPKGGTGKVTISIIPYKDYYHIDVSDNGRGIPPEELKKLPDSFPKTARIGLYNIHTRLYSLFEKGLVLQSQPNIGTSVSFVVNPEVEKRLLEERDAQL